MFFSRFIVFSTLFSVGSGMFLSGPFPYIHPPFNFSPPHCYIHLRFKVLFCIHNHYSLIRERIINKSKYNEQIFPCGPVLAFYNVDR